ncbi:MAG TPA: 50S ribosomal protein L11 methyltransferase [Pyrinomonadaceae bacterium]|nr:50S ribosomal protein L11 methyltransferase [Pyrinomonadaceae bacterium]HMP63998.1 50S ribosomal protein L11 methyltransferase [Pyrinomonadaceae bacterium]
MASRKTWHTLSITARPAAVEALESAFNQLDALGTEIDHVRRRPDEPVVVTGYFDQKPQEADVDLAVSEALRIYSSPQGSVIGKTWSTIEETDWLSAWKQHWTPTVTGCFIVSPPWLSPAAPGKQVILIEPNMAFGTGTHETTRLCLTAIEHHLRPSDKMLDVGTGTGVLAIAAAKLQLARISGAGEISACDTDEDSVKLAFENAILNGVENTVSFHRGSISDATPAADLVCANLTLDVILPMLDLLLEKTNRVLILSGILEEQESDVLAALAGHGFQRPEVDRSGEWISVTIDKTMANLL